MTHAPFLRLLLRLLFVGCCCCCCCCLNTYFTLLYCSSYVVVGHRIRDSMSRTLRIRSASLSNFEGSEKNRFPHKSRTDPNISSYFNARSCRARTPSHQFHIHTFYLILYTFFYLSTRTYTCYLLTYLLTNILSLPRCCWVKFWDRRHSVLGPSKS